MTPESGTILTTSFVPVHALVQELEDEAALARANAADVQRQLDEERQLTADQQSLIDQLSHGTPADLNGKRLIYVDFATGDDSRNGGAPSERVRTIRRAVELMEDHCAVLLHSNAPHELRKLDSSGVGWWIKHTDVVLGSYGGANAILRALDDGLNHIRLAPHVADVTIEHLAFDCRADDPSVRDTTCIVIEGRKVAVRNCDILRAGQFVSIMRGHGVTIEGNVADSGAALELRFAWAQAFQGVRPTDIRILRNRVANVTGGHVVRLEDFVGCVLFDNELRQTTEGLPPGTHPTAGQQTVRLYGENAAVICNQITGGTQYIDGPPLRIANGESYRTNLYYVGNTVSNGADLRILKDTIGGIVAGNSFTGSRISPEGCREVFIG